MSDFSCNDFDEISRDPNDVTTNFTIIPNELIRDSTISPMCRWLIIYLLSHKETWKISTNQLRKHLDGFVGRDKIRQLLNEAIEAGYMTKKEVRKPFNNGFICGFNYVVASQRKFKKCLRKTENQGAENQGSAKSSDLREPEIQGLKEELKEDYLKKRKCIKEKKDSAVPKTASLSLRSAKASLTHTKNLNKIEKVKYGSHVKLFPEEYESLCTQNTKSQIDLLIERMNDYCLSCKPSGYKDYAAALRNWIRKENTTHCVSAHTPISTNALKTTLTNEEICANRHNTEEFCKKNWNNLTAKGVFLRCSFQHVEIEKWSAKEVISTKKLVYDDPDFLDKLKNEMKDILKSC